MSTPTNTPARARILVVEDSALFREMQGLLLGQAGYAVSSHGTPQTALEAAAKEAFELVIIDYELPEMNGQAFMHELRKVQPDIAVIFVSGSLTLDLAIQLSSEGVAGIFNKPANPKNLLEKINETLARTSARDTAARAGGSGSPLPPARRGNSNSPFGTGAVAASELSADRLAYAPRFVLGSSDRFREFTHRLWKVRDFRAVLLLQGEAGSPFELLAREMAEISIFRDGPIMSCDAAQFEPRRLIEVLAPSLLSHDAGTLVITGVEAFNEEQQKTLENLMSGRSVFLPFARRFRLVVAATGALTQRVDEGTFGETLFYKVSSLSLTVPTLREMRGDIATNARRILALHQEAGHPGSPVEIAEDAADWIEQQDWPGNYDELAGTLLNALRFATGEVLTLDAIADSWPHRDDPSAPGMPAPQPMALAETDAPAAGEARPPFPIASTLVDEPKPAAGNDAEEHSTPPLTASPVAAAKSSSVASVARAPAGKLFGRPAAPAPAPVVQSQFRPASFSYDFARRLEESLATADACGAH